MAEHPQMGCATVWLHNGDTSLIHRHFPIRFPVGGRHCVRGRQTNMALPPKKHIIIPFRGGGGWHLKWGTTSMFPLHSKNYRTLDSTRTV